jgi:hypothetical protein
MIPVPDAEAAYNRVTHFNAQPGDLDLLVAAAAQGGMPAPIVTLGNAVKGCQDASTAYEADGSEANAAAWQAADLVLRDLIVNHLDLDAA